MAGKRLAVLCPSARPSQRDAGIIGIVLGDVAEPRVAYTPGVVAPNLSPNLPEGVEPTEVFRFAAPCARAACRHFQESKCQLASKVASNLQAVVSEPPPCAIRLSCRWWQQEGVAACLRCPQIVTDTYRPSELLRQTADPES
jgi:hypothetical protein